MNTGMMGISSLDNQQSQNSQGYTGIVDVQGQQVQVQGGIANFQGQKYFISNNGEMVVDQQRNLLGKVEGGKFVPVNNAQIQELRTKGHLEGGQK